MKIKKGELVFLLSVIIGVLLLMGFGKENEVDNIKQSETSAVTSCNSFNPVKSTSSFTVKDKTIKVEKIDFSLDVPKKDSTFKSYMNYKKITNKSTKQYEMQQNAETNELGLRTYNGMYMIALGTYYTQECGEVFNITFDTDKTIKCIVGDFKDNKDTNVTNQYVQMENNKINIIEFIVDTDKLCDTTKERGDISFVDDIFKGNIESIVKIS